MKKFATLVMLASIALLAVSACKSVEPRPPSNLQSKLGVLILAGEGMNSGYTEAWASSRVFETSAKVAAAIQRELELRGTPAQVFLNRDRKVHPRTFVVELLSQDKRDALAQVNIVHKKQGESYSITLRLNYNPLQWGEDPKGQNIITLAGATSEYKLESDLSFSDESLKSYARDFVARLAVQGYVGK